LGWNVVVNVRRSTVHGRGVFACEPIKAGTRVWEFDTTMPVYDRSTLGKLKGRTLTKALCGGYLHVPTQKFLWYADGMQFMNHGGPVSNVGLGYWPGRLEDDHIIALRDIEPGEELLENYGMCLDGGLEPDHWMRPVYLNHAPDHYAFLLDLTGRATLPLEVQEPGRKRRTMLDNAASSTGLASTASKPAVRHAA
jgi:uncharacterized protein